MYWGPKALWAFFYLFMFVFQAQSQEDEKFVGQVRLMNVVEVETTRKNEQYKIRFRDAKKRRFAKYKSFHIGQTHFKDFKSSVLDGFDEMPEQALALDYTDKEVEIQFRRSAGVVSCRFAITEGRRKKKTVSSWLVKGKAEKIFGL